MTLFWNPAEGRLRAGWRLILQALLMAALALIPIFGIAEPLTALHRRGVFLAVFGFPVSGDKEGASLVAIHQLGPPLVTGGAFGPEAGLSGIAASLLGIAVLVAWKKALHIIGGPQLIFVGRRTSRPAAR